MGEEMKIVRADPSHVGYLSTFGKASFIHAYQCTLPQKELRAYVDAAFSESVILEEMKRELAIYFVCQDSRADPCGYAKLAGSAPPACIHSSGCIELQRLYIDSDHRGQGIGRLLACRAEAHTRCQNLKDIWLRVWDGNVMAQAIYRRWKYSVVGKEPYRVGEDQRSVLIMQKSLLELHPHE
jgi:ribosomal protein S18 acetylase RimI-like enzyme